jgi:hypothetical protein
VSLRYHGEDSHGTPLGGFCSCIGITLVLFFTFGTMFSYLSFSQVNTQTLETYVDTTRSWANCTKAGNECMFLNGNTFMPFITLADFNSPKVADLNTYIQPMFFAFERMLNGTAQDTVWYKAVPCTDFYAQVYGNTSAIPPSLQKELTPLWGFEWLCPDFTPDSIYLLQNDPLNYNFGTNFNMVVNFCSAMNMFVADGVVCETDSTVIWNYLANMKVSHKFVR